MGNCQCYWGTNPALPYAVGSPLGSPDVRTDYGTVESYFWPLSITVNPSCRLWGTLTVTELVQVPPLPSSALKEM